MKLFKNVNTVKAQCHNHETVIFIKKVGPFTFNKIKRVIKPIQIIKAMTQSKIQQIIATALRKAHISHKSQHIDVYGQSIEGHTQHFVIIHQSIGPRKLVEICQN